MRQSSYEIWVRCVLVLSAASWSCSADGAGSERRSKDPELISRPNAAPGGGAPAGGIPSSSGSQQLAGSSAPIPQGGAEPSCAAISQQAENRRKPADIIFAVDNSGSMDEEIAFVREQLNAFSQQIVASGIDARIILISAPFGGPQAMRDIFDDDDDEDNGICIAPPLGSGTCPEDSRSPGYFHVPVEVESHDALNLFISAFPQYQAQLRPNATKTFVVVTDDDAEDDPNNSAAAFSQSIAGLPGGLFQSWSFSGIYCFTDCPEAATIGTVYKALVEQTKGVAGDLCLQDFAPVFDALAQAVVSASGLDCAWDIPDAPPGQTFKRDRVNVQYTTQGAPARSLVQVSSAMACAARSGWHYDDPQKPTRIIACPATCAELRNDLQAKVDVLFGCDTLIAPD